MRLDKNARPPREEEKISELKVSELEYIIWREGDLSNLPCGYRFNPDEGELVVYYLANKIMGRPLPLNIISDIDDLLDRDPHEIEVHNFAHGKPNEAFFFAKTDRRDSEIITNYGYWKVVDEGHGSGVEVFYRNWIVGHKRRWVYFEGKPPLGGKTIWNIYEYRFLPNLISPKPKELERRVVCKIQWNWKADEEETSEAGKSKEK